MDAERRKELLFEEDQLTAQVEKLGNRLRGTGQLIESLGSSVRTTPDQVFFSNAPGSLGNHPLAIVRPAPFDWHAVSDAVDLQKLAELLQEYRKATDRLRTVKADLGR